jgi:hypothetical protein
VRWLLVLAILLAAPRARADDYPIVVGATGAVGTGMLAVGVLSDSLFVNTRMALAGIGLAIASLGPAIVHASYGYSERAAYSAVAHSTLPLAGALIGDHDKQRGAGLKIGLFVGLAAAAAIDLVMALRSSDEAPATRMFSFGARF